MRESWQIFLHAVVFFTRIPVTIDYKEERLHKAAAWYPLVGWLVGGFCAGVYWAAAALLPSGPAVGLSIVFGILLTGCFHEDGLADVCDGFGGGMEKRQILEIMKDSRLGTYGAAGLFLVLSLKWSSLSALEPALIPWAIWCGHAVSRAAPTWLIRFGVYARADLESKAKPLSTRLSTLGFLTAWFWGLVPLVFYPDPRVWWSLLPILGLTLWLSTFFKRRIDGYTGDCLGSVQQLTEVVFYLVLLAFAFPAGG